eukprot:8420138-Pyramimonas_sp.AAC.1
MHALTWVVYEQLVDKIEDKVEATTASNNCIIRERALLASHRDGLRRDKAETIRRCKGFHALTALDRIEVPPEPPSVPQ